MSFYNIKHQFAITDQNVVLDTHYSYLLILSDWAFAILISWLQAFELSEGLDVKASCSEYDSLATMYS